MPHIILLVELWQAWLRLIWAYITLGALLYLAWLLYSFLVAWASSAQKIKFLIEGLVALNKLRLRISLTLLIGVFLCPLYPPYALWVGLSAPLLLGRILWNVGVVVFYKKDAQIEAPGAEGFEDPLLPYFQTPKSWLRLVLVRLPAIWVYGLFSLFVGLFFKRRHPTSLAELGKQLTPVFLLSLPYWLCITIWEAAGWASTLPSLPIWGRKRKRVWPKVFCSELWWYLRSATYKRWMQRFAALGAREGFLALKKGRRLLLLPSPYSDLK